MISRPLRWCAIAAVFLTVASPAQAQRGRYGRSGVVQGPDGVLYNTRSPEWRMSGGNIFVYQQLVQQKMMLQQQRAMLRQQRQQQALTRQMKPGSRKAGGRAAAQAGIGQNAGGVANQQRAAAPAQRKRTKPAADGFNAATSSTRNRGNTQSGSSSNSEKAQGSKAATSSSESLEPSRSPD